jgi:hypothetical protein
MDNAIATWEGEGGFAARMAELRLIGTVDKLEAPAKELARQMKLEEDARTAQQSARSINKPKFHP